MNVDNPCCEKMSTKMLDQNLNGFGDCVQAESFVLWVDAVIVLSDINFCPFCGKPINGNSAT